MRRWIPIAVALALSACSVATTHLDETTGTTKAQRCVDYQGWLAAAVSLQEIEPSPTRAERITFYRMFISANCPPP